VGARLELELVGELGQVDHERPTWGDMEAAGTADDSQTGLVLGCEGE
jgi:hypothetical protein